MKAILEFLWPIHKSEFKKFMPMSIMLLLTLFNYNALRSMKDALVVPNIGAESISFIKFFCVVPTAVIFVIIYTKLTNIWNFRRIYITIAIFFACFFMLFGFVFFPNQDFLHPNAIDISNSLVGSLNFGFCEIDLSHFKWFILIYSKWLYALFFIMAELWATMNTLMFWQFANQIVTTHEAKRFYPMFGFMGSFGTFIAGYVLIYLSDLQISLVKDTDFLVQNMCIILTIVTFGIIVFFELINKCVVKDETYLTHIKTKRPATKMTLIESFRLIARSKYLRYIAISVISYGFVLNLLEGPWIAAARIVYSCTDDYLVFAAGVQKMIGGCSMLFMLIGAYILKRYSWITAAMITPSIFFITGTLFFLTVIFEEQAAPYINAVLPIDIMLIAVYFGTIQTVLSKSTKYALFDSTKEMTYIPIDYQLKSKGKAAVDVLGMKLAISGAALVQSLLFTIFPGATYLNIAGVLMTIFLVICLIWFSSVRSLNREYLAALAKYNAKNSEE